MEKRARYILLGIFLAVLAVRLALAFSLPNFTYESYFHLRQVEEITNTGLPLYYDPLSYGGRELIFLPFFHYLIALFNLLLPLELIAKIIPNLLMASLVFLAYLIAKEISRDETASLISAFTAGLLPILYSPNSFTPESLFLPLTLLAIYTFLNLHQKKYLYLYLVSLVILSFTSSAAFLLIIGFGIYLFLSLLEGKKIDRGEKELIIFSLFFFIWSQFIFFKGVFLEEGISFIWQNVPPQIISEYFPKISLLQALFLVSVIPFLAGIYTVYRSLFQTKNQKAFFLLSFVVSLLALAWLRLLQFRLALALLGLILAVFFALFYQDLAAYTGKTKLHRWQKYAPFIVIIILALTMLPPALNAAYQQDMPTVEEANAFRWISKSLPPDSGILTSLEEGHLLTFYGQRRNYMDDQFELIKDVEERFRDLNSLYGTSFETLAFDLYNKHNLQYVVLTPRTKEKYSLPYLKYWNPKCFKNVYKNETKIYRVKCELETTEDRDKEGK